ncbi:MAG TPA: enoyl-CoA hydratase/isomerase family protein [Actinomycetota bacterium]|nr:enoyl-CoA hydratase/isomerase family protein [Actinomycetota bacterium]
MGDLIDIELSSQYEGVAVLHLRHPPLNIVNRQLTGELAAATRTLGRDEAVRAVVVWGGRHFSAGGDLAEFAAMSVTDVYEYGKDLDAAYRGLADLPKVTIAAVNGYALGGGCELALAADFRFVGERATLGLPEIQLGLIPGAGGTQRLPRLVGLSRAKELIFTGRQVKAAEAVAIGLADAVFPPEQLLDQALEAAARYARGPTVALRVAKRAIDRAVGGLDEGLELERGLFSTLFGTEDWRRGATSFLEEGPGKATFVGR